MHKFNKKVLHSVVLLNVVLIFALIICGFTPLNLASASIYQKSAETTMQSDEILLSAFFTSNEDTSPYIYTSVDGINFDDPANVKPNSIVDDDIPTSLYGKGHRDPSIMYRNGYFWLIGGFGTDKKNNAYFSVMYSKDLYTWSANKNIKIPVAYNPYSTKTFFHDGCAPEWFQDTDGSLYILLTAGDMYSETEVNLGENGKLYPYITKVTDLQPNIASDGTLKAAHITTGTAKEMKLNTVIKYSQRDSFLYKENGIYYFYARYYEPYTVQVWTSTSLTGTWTLFDKDVYNRPMSSAYSFRQIEANCLVKFKGKYILYGDKYDSRDGDLGVNGGQMQYSFSDNLGNFIAPKSTIGPRGLRHGTVINVSDPEAKKVIWNYRLGSSKAKITRLNSTNANQRYGSDFSITTSPRGILYKDKAQTFDLSVYNTSENDSEPITINLNSSSNASILTPILNIPKINKDSVYKTKYTVIPNSSSKIKVTISLSTLGYSSCTMSQINSCRNISYQNVYASKKPTGMAKPYLKQRFNAGTSSCDEDIPWQAGGNFLTVCPNAPTNDGGNLIKNYEIKLKAKTKGFKDIKVTTDGSATPYTFENLPLYTSWQVIIRAKNDYGWTPEVKGGSFKISNSQPSLIKQNPQNVKMKWESTGEISVHFDHPSTMHNIGSFTIKLMNGDQVLRSRTVKWNETQYVFTSYLGTCDCYIKVAADQINEITGVGVGQSKFINSNHKYITYPETPFSDLSYENEFAADIVWVYKMKITTGVNHYFYKPNSKVTRGQMAAFMYRLKGQPKFTATKNIKYFKDLKNIKSKFNKEIRYIVTKNISRGSPECNFKKSLPLTCTFRKDNKVTRGQMAVFLYRLAGSPKIKVTKKDLKIYTDIKKLPPLRQKAIIWLKKKGITTTSGKYKPNNFVSRGSMAAFLHRFYLNTQNI